MESDFGVTKVEWSAVVMFVCVCVWPNLCNLVIVMDRYHTHSAHACAHTHITSAVHSTFATPKSDSTPILQRKTPLHRIHRALSLLAATFVNSSDNIANNLDPDNT